MNVVSRYFIPIIFVLLCMEASENRALAFPGDVFKLDSASVVLPGPKGHDIAQQCVNDSKAILEDFLPTGATITEKTVTVESSGAPVISFKATKRIAGFEMTLSVKGTFTHSLISCLLPSSPCGYRLELNLRDSDSEVSDNVDYYFVDVCLTEHDDSTSIIGASFGREGPHFASLMGQMVKQLLRQQTQAIVDAFMHCAIRKRSGI